MFSMTGFGSSTMMYDPYKINVEVKSLNSKFADVRLKAPDVLSSLDMDIRQIALEISSRGKIEISVSLDGQNLEGSLSEIDEQVFSNYYNQLERLSKKLGIKPKNIISSIVQLPGVIKLQEFKVDKKMQDSILKTVREALHSLMDHRQIEGKALALALNDSTKRIIKKQAEIATMESERMDQIKLRLRQNLEQNIPPEKVDSGRYEQELIYYLDKMDIHEEMIRLKQHCEYFLEELENGETMKGKKLGFISQEIGREVNTLGAKANHAEIQRLVVEMKNEVDKIKEQLANVL